MYNGSFCFERDKCELRYIAASRVTWKRLSCLTICWCGCMMSRTFIHQTRLALNLSDTFMTNVQKSIVESVVNEQHTGKLNWGYEQVNVMVLKLHVFFFGARSRIFGHLKMILFPNWVLPLLAISYELIYSTCPLVISSLHVWDVYDKMLVNTRGIGEEEKIPKFKFNY